jgi:hypothetical protein
MIRISETSPKSRSPVRSLLSRPRLSSLPRCVPHATAPPLFTHKPARRSKGTHRPDLHRHPQRFIDLAAELSCGPLAAKDAMSGTKARLIFLQSPSSIVTIKESRKWIMQPLVREPRMSSTVHWS